MFDREGNVREDAEEKEPAAAVSEESIPEVGVDGPAADRDASRETPSADTPPRESETSAPTAGPTPGPAATGPAAGGPQSAPTGGGAPAGGSAPGGPGAERISEDRIQAAMDADLDERGNVETGGQSAAELPRDFGSFIESQYYETLLFLGAMRHPATGETVEDLDMARYKIDLLSMLQDKTEGNRSPEESRLLDDVLYQLRMGYLQKRKVAKL